MLKINTVGELLYAAEGTRVYNIWSEKNNGEFSYLTGDSRKSLVVAMRGLRAEVSLFNYDLACVTTTTDGITTLVVSTRETRGSGRTLYKDWDTVNTEAVLEFFSGMDYDSYINTMAINEYSVNAMQVSWLMEVLEDVDSDYRLVGHNGKQAIVLRRGGYASGDMYDIILVEAV